MNLAKNEIEQLEKTVHTLVRLPWLVRRQYWVSQIERLLDAATVSAQDRRRLVALLDLIATLPTDSEVSGAERIVSVTTHGR